jgi:hypothetical protein
MEVIFGVRIIYWGTIPESCIGLNFMLMWILLFIATFLVLSIYGCVY